MFSYQPHENTGEISLIHFCHRVINILMILYAFCYAKAYKAPLQYGDFCINSFCVPIVSTPGLKDSAYNQSCLIPFPFGLLHCAFQRAALEKHSEALIGLECMHQDSAMGYHCELP